MSIRLLPDGKEQQVRYQLCASVVHLPQTETNRGNSSTRGEPSFRVRHSEPDLETAGGFSTVKNEHYP